MGVPPIDPIDPSQDRVELNVAWTVQDVLKGVTFSVEPRMKVAVVGILDAGCSMMQR